MSISVSLLDGKKVAVVGQDTFATKDTAARFITQWQRTIDQIGQQKSALNAEALLAEKQQSYDAQAATFQTKIAELQAIVGQLD